MFGKREMEVLRKMIHQVADFSGVHVLTYCLMNNHFHILIRVPPAEVVSDAELMRRYRVLYPKPSKYESASINLMMQKLNDDGHDAELIRQRLLARMGDVSAFMKTLKQRFSTWFNRSHNRFGPLWADRFKSVLVEGHKNVLQTMAAYIDLNPVRAGLVSDPKDYRFCGYAEAMAGRKAALNGLKFVTAGLYEIENSKALQSYRCMLFGKGAAPGKGAQMTRQDALRVLEKENGSLPSSILLRCKIRYFSEGAVIGSREFVEMYAATWQDRMARKLPFKPKLISTNDNEPLSVLKHLRGNAFI
jgi:REP element-mobilizing transposase RayT